LVINRLIKYLLAYDLILSFALGLLVPFLSVFVIQDIHGGNIKVAGLSFTVYWLVRVITVTPLARFMDSHDGERDEYFFTIAGSFMLSTLMLFFIWADKAWHIYLIQGLIGASNSMAVPGWRILFTDHLDKGKVGLEWSFDDIVIGISTAVSAYLGAIIVDDYGFKTLFVIISILGYIGTLMLIPTWKSIRKKPKHKRKRTLIAKDPFPSG